MPRTVYFGWICTYVILLICITCHPSKQNQIMMQLIFSDFTSFIFLTRIKRTCICFLKDIKTMQLLIFGLSISQDFEIQSLSKWGLLLSFWLSVLLLHMLEISLIWLRTVVRITIFSCLAEWLCIYIQGILKNEQESYNKTFKLFF